MGKPPMSLPSEMKEKKKKTMGRIRTVRIYNITPSGYKPTAIRVKEYETNVFCCYFLDVNVVNEFKSIGFKVSIMNGEEIISLNGKLDLNFAAKVWEAFFEKKDAPDIEFSIEDIDGLPH